ncbi:Acid phosphatase-like protein [Hapsidospora chrysogenum ATCC 11550]|uniref:Acid phosphatase-like protein n=1 Tax=Hapsidospora chrysogenum (strain ATCC 11550 / CBS 779.69 / DSM 880 / IAM 14645 / JCM 23072 / IMI 49137) TaxID=857340 RepID=A0A086T357_HAPC1|nr:Acid phosphatase-like protein [Hapsidospora chrysogenum ATCC 11550]
MNNDGFHHAPRNISTVIDVLKFHGISWALYQEDMPYTGFEGFEWKNPETSANDYVRKQNPAILHDSLTHDKSRLSRIENLSMMDTSRSIFS